MSVTRLEIADTVGHAFGPQGASKGDLLAAAARQGAHPVVITELQRLPDITYRTMRSLWDHLPEVVRE